MVKTAILCLKCSTSHKPGRPFSSGQKYSPSGSNITVPTGFSLDLNLILGSSFGHFLRKGRVKKEGFFDFVYPEVNEGFFAFGPFVLFRVNNIFGAPIDCSFSFEEVAGVNNLQEVISSYSGIIKIYIKKTTGVFMRGLKEVSNTRRSYSIELGIFF